MLAGMVTAAVTSPPRFVAKPCIPAYRTWSSITSWMARSTSPWASRSSRSAFTEAGGSGPTASMAARRDSCTKRELSSGAAFASRGAIPLPSELPMPMSSSAVRPWCPLDPTGVPVRHPATGLCPAWMGAMPTEPHPTGWVFPDVSALPPDSRAEDLVAAGADLEPGTLLAAYRQGLFPMPADLMTRVRTRRARASVAWWSPVERGVLPLDGLRVSRSLRQSVRRMEVRVDTAFGEVITACADPSRDGGWIDDQIVAAYSRLHELGWAHSVEAWQDGELVGGLYGVAVGGLFAGESMFHRARDASKVALVGLVDLLRDEHADHRLLDVQWRTEHLASLGVVSVPRPSYLRMLRRALEVPLPRAF